MKTVYIADDGTQFDKLEDCKNYETFSVKAKVALVNTVKQIEQFKTSKHKIFYYAKINNVMYNGYDGKKFYVRKSDLIKSLETAIGECSGYRNDEKVNKEILDLMVQTNVVLIGAISL